MQQQPKISRNPKVRWSNGWYGLALALALLVFGLRGLASVPAEHSVHPVAIYAAQSERILL